MPIKPPVFKPKEPLKLPEIHYSERLKRVKRAHRDINFEYQLNTSDIRNEELFNIYAHKYPDQVRSKLMTFCRVRIPEQNMFELDESGTLDEIHNVKEALVWSESKKCMDPKNPITNALCQANILHGVYRRPYATTVPDEYGNPTDKSRITSNRNTFYIEFNEKNVNAVLEKFEGKYRILTLATANPGSESWYILPTHQIPNLQDWKTESWDNLISANLGGFLRGDYEGGVQLFLKDKADKKKKMEAEIAEFNNNKAKSGTTQNKSNRK